MLHVERLRRTKNRKCTAGNAVTQAIMPASERCSMPKRVQAGLPASQQKNREEKINSPPGLKLGVVDPKKFGAVNEALGLMPFFLRCFFLCCFFLCHR